MLMVYRCITSSDVGVRCLHVLWDGAIFACPLLLFEPPTSPMPYLLHLRSPNEGSIIRSGTVVV